MTRNNTFHYRHFLICNKMANDIMNVRPQNFAQLIVEEEEGGRFMNSQMTCYFHSVNRTLCDLIGNYEDFVWEELDMNEVAKLTPEELEEDYNNFCSGQIRFEV